MNAWISPEEATAALSTGTGAGVRIAVLDSGIEIGHSTFHGRSLTHDFVIDLETSDPLTPGNGSDPYGHGTAVAGAIWKAAPEAEIGSFRVLGPNLSARSARIAVAAEAAIGLGYQILNCSFACGIPGHLPIYWDWANRALAAGVHVIAAAEAGDRDEWPGSLATVVAARHGEIGDQKLALTPSHRDCPIFLVGADDSPLPWQNQTFRCVTGSSFAAATLSGMIARLLSCHPINDAHLLKAVLVAMARAQPSQPRLHPELIR